MEDILDLYAQSYDPAYPQVCFDERPCILHGEVVEPLPMQPGQPLRYDHEYQRNGQCNLFMALQPLQGWRLTEVTERRTAVDCAHFLRDLVDVHFPEAIRIRLVLDNLNTHTPAALYTAFPPEEAHRIARKLEFHYTPKYASWLNMAEMEFAALVKQCLNRRIPNLDTLDREVTAWRDARNTHRTTIRWCFNVHDARTKLARFYP
jgi:DDE superfamily endonuclease